MNKMMKVRDIASEKLMPISKVGTDIPLMLMYGVGLGISYLTSMSNVALEFFLLLNRISIFFMHLYLLLIGTNCLSISMEKGLEFIFFLGKTKMK